MKRVRKAWAAPIRAYVRRAPMGQDPAPQVLDDRQARGQLHDSMSPITLHLNLLPSRNQAALAENKTKIGIVDAADLDPVTTNGEPV